MLGGNRLTPRKCIQPTTLPTRLARLSPPQSMAQPRLARATPRSTFSGLARATPRKWPSLKALLTQPYEMEPMWRSAM